VQRLLELHADRIDFGRVRRGGCERARGSSRGPELVAALKALVDDARRAARTARTRKPAKRRRKAKKGARGERNARHGGMLGMLTSEAWAALHDAQRLMRLLESAEVVVSRRRPAPQCRVTRRTNDASSLRRLVAAAPRRDGGRLAGRIIRIAAPRSLGASRLGPSLKRSSRRAREAVLSGA
jgi:hypothetical protein